MISLGAIVGILLLLFLWRVAVHTARETRGGLTRAQAQAFERDMARRQAQRPLIGCGVCGYGTTSPADLAAHKRDAHGVGA